MVAGRLLAHVLAALAVVDVAYADKKKADKPSSVASAVLAGQTFVNKVRPLQMPYCHVVPRIGSD
jgi:hypothetical protein